MYFKNDAIYKGVSVPCPHILECCYNKFFCFEQQNWSFFLALPRLIMLSHLQNLIGGRGNRTPSILPNDYMDNLLTNVKLTMKER